MKTDQTFRTRFFFLVVRPPCPPEIFLFPQGLGLSCLNAGEGPTSGRSEDSESERYYPITTPGTITPNLCYTHR